MRRTFLTAALAILGLISCSCATAQQSFEAVQPTEARIPDPPREMRAMWISSVNNGVWPSKRSEIVNGKRVSVQTLNPADQRKEMIALLDRAQALNLNTVIFQVRTECDALYPSPIEPWSEFLTGTQGKAPSPMWDPLQTWIDESHKRGLELHAWFNPYRARAGGGRTDDPKHVSKTHPNIVRQYGNMLWLDPSDPETIRYSLSVFHDVVRRYNVDGIHIDDYFYPYQIPKDPKNPKAGNIDFPDEPTWQRYKQSGGQLSRSDWRRQSVNTMVEALYADIKKTKPNVKFGISPFGIWRPKNPPEVEGLDQYESLYADAKLWLNKGWCDYFSPQLYWPTTAPKQPFAKLVQWWSRENTQKRILAPGIAIGRNAADTPKEIELSRQYGQGVVHWHGGNLLKNDQLANTLKTGLYAQPALVPAMPWIDQNAPGKPELKVNRSSGALDIDLEPDRGEKPSLWAIYAHTGGKWEFSVLPASQTHVSVNAAKAATIDMVAAAAVDNCGNLSPWAVVKSTAPAPSTPSAAPAR